MSEAIGLDGAEPMPVDAEAGTADGEAAADGSEDAQGAAPAADGTETDVPADAGADAAEGAES